MTFDEWWEKNGKDCPNAERLFADRIFAEMVWNAAQKSGVKAIASRERRSVNGLVDIAIAVVLILPVGFGLLVYCAITT